MLGRKAKGTITPNVGNIITLYTQGKISQVETAENMIIKLLNSKTDEQQQSVFKQYDKLIGKSETKEPLSKRLVEKKVQKERRSRNAQYTHACCVHCASVGENISMSRHIRIPKHLKDDDGDDDDNYNNNNNNSNK